MCVCVRVCVLTSSVYIDNSVCLSMCVCVCGYKWYTYTTLYVYTSDMPCTMSAAMCACARSAPQQSHCGRCPAHATSSATDLVEATPHSVHLLLHAAQQTTVCVPRHKLRHILVSNTQRATPWQKVVRHSRRLCACRGSFFHLCQASAAAVCNPDACEGPRWRPSQHKAGAQAGGLAS